MLASPRAERVLAQLEEGGKIVDFLINNTFHTSNASANHNK